MTRRTSLLLILTCLSLVMLYVGPPIRSNTRKDNRQVPNEPPSRRDVALALDQASPEIPSDHQGLSPQLQGSYPIHIPTYEGVEQLLVLSNRWIIVVTSNLDDVSKEIHRLSGVDFLGAQQVWIKSKSNPSWDWTLRRNTIDAAIDKYVIEARLNAGELLLDSPSYYHITSSDDAHYQDAHSPSRVTRFIVSRDGERVGGFEIDYAHYSYLEMPLPLVNGKTYTVTLDNGKNVSFLYDEHHTVARTIKVNQVGYLPDVQHKYAYLSGYLQEFGPMDFSFADEFKVIDVDNGQEVLIGKIQLRAENPHFQHPGWKLWNLQEARKTDPSLPDLPTLPAMTGENIYELDLSELTKPGTYFISIPQVGRSWPFRVDRDIYGEAFYTAMRGMFAQRCGIALTKEHSAWTRKQCHDWPAFESEFVTLDSFMNNPGEDAFDIIGATIDKTKATPGPVGGWHDASDWDKNMLHMTNVLAMLTIFEMMPHKFRDGQLHLPESGNGIPDILDEAIFGLQVWKKSMRSEGGVAGTWETFTHPSIDDPEYQYAYGRRSRWTSLFYASAAAQLAHLLKPFDEQKAAVYEADAKLAYEFGTNPANSLGTVTIHANRDRGKGEPYTLTWTEEDRYHWPYLVSAKIRLFILTQDSRYLEDIEDLLDKLPEPFAWPAKLSDYFSFLYWGLFSPAIQDHISLKQRKKWTALYVDQGRQLSKLSAIDPYRRSKEQHPSILAWGMGVVTNQAKWLLLSHFLGNSPIDRDVALWNIDYQLGANPQGMVWTTGMGMVYPIYIQHSISELDGIMDPFPGIAIYGPTGNGYRMVNRIWWGTDPNGKQVRFLSNGYWDEDNEVKLAPELRRYMTHPHFLVDQNEFTIHETMASGLFSFGYLMNDDWMPSEALKNRVPRSDHLLFGYWFLP